MFSERERASYTEILDVEGGANVPEERWLLGQFILASIQLQLSQEGICVTTLKIDEAFLEKEGRDLYIFGSSKL